MHSWMPEILLGSRKGAKDAKASKSRVEEEHGVAHPPPRHVHRDLQLALTLFPLAILAAWRDTFRGWDTDERRFFSPHAKARRTQRLQSPVLKRRMDFSIHCLATCIVMFSLRSLAAIHVWRRATCRFTEHV